MTIAPVLQVDAVCREGQRLRDPASGISERGAEGADFADLGIVCSLQESLPLGGSQVLAMTVMVVESIHAADLNTFRRPLGGGAILLTLWPLCV